MPAYSYQCVTCQTRETRIGGVDDDVAICNRCGYLMIRLDNDVFAPYFADLESKLPVSHSKGQP